MLKYKISALKCAISEILYVMLYECNLHMYHRQCIAYGFLVQSCVCYKHYIFYSIVRIFKNTV